MQYRELLSYSDYRAQHWNKYLHLLLLSEEEWNKSSLLTNTGWWLLCPAFTSIWGQSEDKLHSARG